MDLQSRTMPLRKTNLRSSSFVMDKLDQSSAASASMGAPPLKLEWCNGPSRSLGANSQAAEVLACADDSQDKDSEVQDQISLLSTASKKNKPLLALPAVEILEPKPLLALPAGEILEPKADGNAGVGTNLAPNKAMKRPNAEAAEFALGKEPEAKKTRVSGAQEVLQTLKEKLSTKKREQEEKPVAKAKAKSKSKKNGSTKTTDSEAVGHEKAKPKAKAKSNSKKNGSTKATDSEAVHGHEKNKKAGESENFAEAAGFEDTKPSKPSSKASAKPKKTVPQKKPAAAVKKKNNAAQDKVATESCLQETVSLKDLEAMQCEDVEMPWGWYHSKEELLRQFPNDSEHRFKSRCYHRILCYMTKHGMCNEKSKLYASAALRKGKKQWAVLFPASEC